MWSDHHNKWTLLRVHVIAFLMDQPERRGSNCLLGGNSKQHPLFGVSCNFGNLERRFSACPECVQQSKSYLKRGLFDIVMEQSTCRLCYGFSLSRLLEHGKCVDACNVQPSVNMPGGNLVDKPGKLSFVNVD